jgi:hypothetical protein
MRRGILVVYRMLGARAGDGVNTRALGPSWGRVRTLSTWEQSELERAHLRIVERWLAPAGTVGPRVAAVLAGGRTIGIAHLSFRAGMISALFRAALRLAWNRKRQPPAR